MLWKAQKNNGEINFDSLFSFFEDFTWFCHRFEREKWKWSRHGKIDYILIHDICSVNISSCSLATETRKVEFCRNLSESRFLSGTGFRGQRNVVAASVDFSDDFRWGTFKLETRASPFPSPPVLSLPNYFDYLVRLFSLLIINPLRQSSECVALSTTLPLWKLARRKRLSV